MQPKKRRHPPVSYGNRKRSPSTRKIRQARKRVRKVKRKPRKIPRLTAYTTEEWLVTSTFPNGQPKGAIQKATIQTQITDPPLNTVPVTYGEKWYIEMASCFNCGATLTPNIAGEFCKPECRKAFFKRAKKEDRELDHRRHNG